ncbi:hypothetical protein K1719_044630 [Acacia pycnantha]|nr:hypothetical protein K1719_044630 [Acacia pycnantha]
MQPSYQTWAISIFTVAWQLATIPPPSPSSYKILGSRIAIILFHAPQHMMDETDDVADSSGSGSSRTYVRDAKAMATTPADMKEYPNSYVFIFDMPDLKSGDIKVQVEDDNML